MPDSADSHKRLILFNQLVSLPEPQLNQVIFTLKPAVGNVSSSRARSGERVPELLQWAESPIGCGLEEVERVLEEVLADAQVTSEQPTLEGTAANRQDVQVRGSVENSAVVSGDGNRVEVHHHYGLPDTKPEPTRADKNEKTLIDAVWTEVEDRLRQSLHNAILIRLDMAEQRNQVSRPWDSQLRTATQGSKPLDPNTHIVEVFDRRDVGGKLLILGHPGSGKTTTMLDLAAKLIQRANDQPDHPIPVMFNLSSWQSAKQSITDWLLSELKLKYGVSQKLGQTWLTNQKLLLLLDGLDELPSGRQEPVVQAINEWLQSGEGPNRVLVCSRIEEYELYAAKLALNGAVCLEPLTDRQLQNYLNSMQMGQLWETLQQDAALLELVRTPLLLSVSILANDAIDPAQWQQKQTTQARTTYLLDAYVERRLHEAVKSREYPTGKEPKARQIRHWLVWLAHQMNQEGQSEFLIERIQPSWLVEKDAKKVYLTRVSLLISLIYVSPFIIILSFSGSLTGFVVGSLLISFVLGGQVYMIFYLVNQKRQEILLSESVTWSASLIAKRIKKPFISFFKELKIEFRKFQAQTNRERLLLAPKTTLFNILIVAFLIIIVSMNIKEIVGIIYLLANSLALLLFALPYMGIDTAEIEHKINPNQGIWRSLKNSLITAFMIESLLALTGFLIGFFGVIAANEKPSYEMKSVLGAIVENSLLYAFVIGCLLGLMFLFLGILFFVPSVSMICGLNTCIKHFLVRVSLHGSGNIPWNYARFLNHCTERLLLQRVGGRYRFIHKQVQEHFAVMSLEGK